MQTTITIIHIIVTLALIAVVLFQTDKGEGLSGSIAGGAETFFGKNKGKTADALFEKLTAVLAFLFIITSLILSIYYTVIPKA